MEFPNFPPSSEKTIIFVIVGAELEAFMNDALWNPFTPLLAENNSTITYSITLDVRCGTLKCPKFERAMVTKSTRALPAPRLRPLTRSTAVGGQTARA